MTSQSGWRKLTVVLTGFLALIVFPIYAVKVSLKTDYTDFGVYHRASQRATQSQWSEIYNLGDGASPFRYAPPTLTFFRPFGALSPYAAKMTWFALQYLWFGLGFYFLYRTLRITRKKANPLDPFWIVSLSFLFVLRFCLDSFTIGQTSSLLFFGYCLGLYAWVIRRSALSSLGVFVPTLFKIGPGFLYLLLLTLSGRDRLRVIFTPILFLALLCIPVYFWIGNFSDFSSLWNSWATIVANDSVYYDASHYGSQSLKSALLRMGNHGWLSSSQVLTIYMSSTLIGCTGVALFWLLRRPKTLQDRMVFYSMGVFPYLWFMPETFKYSLTVLAIPVAALLNAKQKDLLSRLALAFGFFTLSIAGKDLIGDALFFSMQKASFPFSATLLLAAASFRLAWKGSQPSYLSSLLSISSEKLGPWETTTQELTREISLLIPLPLQSYSPLHAKRLKSILESYLAFFKAQAAGQFEFIFVAYGDRQTEFHPIFQSVKKLSDQHPELKWAPTPEVDGRGAALRSGFLASTGKKILIAQLEQPGEPEFYSEAITHLNQGFDLIRANRRHENSRFKTPVRLLSLVYGRHRMGLLFNRWVRWILPIQTTDTHSGTLALSRRLAHPVFALQTSAEFLFDLEISLTAQAHGYREKDLPFTLYLAEEKGFKRMLHETCNILYGLPLLAWRYRLGYYHPQPSARGITADDWGLSAGVNRGILELARLGIIHRVSIMAFCPAVQEGLEELKKIPGIQLGLHFNLTYGKRIRPELSHHCGPRKFLLRWISPWGNKKDLIEAVRKELKAQIQQLTQLGVQLQYLDGHHHIHLVPGLLNSVADELRTAGIRYVRLPYDPGLWLTSKFPIAVLCVLARSALKKNEFEYLPCFYPQKGDFLDHGRLRARLAKYSGSEVIVHPAEINDLQTLEYPDSYTSGRVTEYRALRMLNLGGPLS